MKKAVRKTKEPQGCIYHSVNLKNEKGYVGQHKNVATVERRWEGHIREARKGSKLLFHRALRKNKYEEGFSWEVVWVGPVSKLNEMETYFIAKLGTFVDDARGGGYNLTTGGGVYAFAVEVKLRMSDAAKRRVSAPMELERLRTIGRSTWDDEDNRKLLLAALRRPSTVATRNAVHAANWSDPVYSAKMLRAMNSPEACKKRGAKRKALWADPEHHAYMLKVLNTPEATAKISAASRKPENIASRTTAIRRPEVRAQMSATHTKNWAGSEYHEKMLAIHNSDKTKAKHSETSLSMWKDPVQREVLLAGIRAPEERARRSASASDPVNIAARTVSIQTEQCRSRMSNSARARWADPVERAKLLATRARKSRERKLASAEAA